MRSLLTVFLAFLSSCLFNPFAFAETQQHKLKLTPAEEYVLEQVEMEEEAHFRVSDKRGADFQERFSKKEDRTLSAEFLYGLFEWAVVRIKNARIRGALSLVWDEEGPKRQIHTAISLINCNFENKVDFAHSRFWGEINFSKTTFSESAHFHNVTFEKSSYFRESNFKGGAYFSFAGFSNYADFYSVSFNSRAIFDDARFYNSANFTKVRFSDDTSFKGVNFFHDAQFAEAEFSGIAEFHGAGFSAQGDLTGTSFSGKADFKGAKFSGGADFSDTQFSGKADFVGTQFSGRANFIYAKFFEEAYFTESKFSELADFKWVTFLNKADFMRAKFLEDAIFSSNIFSGEAHFKETKFSENTYFYYTKFSKEADFSRCVFTSKSFFKDAFFNGPVIFDDVSGFSNMSIKWKYSPGEFHIDKDGKKIKLKGLSEQLKFNETFYIALIKNYRDMGWFKETDDCYYTYRVEKRINRKSEINMKNKDIEKHLPAIGRWWTKAGLQGEWLLLDLTFGYGVRPDKIFITFLAFWIPFSFYYVGFVRSNYGQKLSLWKAWNPIFKPSRFLWSLIYSLDTITPGVNFESLKSLKQKVLIKSDSKRILYARRFQQILGWYWAALFLILLTLTAYEKGVALPTANTTKIGGHV